MKAAVDASEGATDMLSQPGTSYAPGPGVRMRRGIAGGQRGQRGQRLARQGAAASKIWLGLPKRHRPKRKYGRFACR